MTKPAIQSVKLAKLQLSAINVRTPGNDLIEQLAADVDARGIIQNLIVAPLKKPRGSFAVIAGSRRYRALMLLSERGQIDAAQYDVPVMVIEADDAALSETSLAENFHHLAMSPADECRAFQHFIGENGDLDAVAKRFGVTRKFVEGRLRLADLAEPIFNALAEGKITLDMAKAYATSRRRLRGRGWKRDHPRRRSALSSSMPSFPMTSERGCSMISRINLPVSPIQDLPTSESAFEAVKMLIQI